MLQTIGPSMLPTIDSTLSIFLTEKISTRFGKVDRGDIVVFCDPQKPGHYLTKRVIGLEGDSITYSSNPETNDLVDDNFTHISYPENNDKPQTVVVCSISSYKLNSYFYFIILIMGSVLLVF